MARLLPYATQTPPPRAGGRQMLGFLRLAGAFVVGALLASILRAAVHQHRWGPEEGSACYRSSRPSFITAEQPAGMAALQTAVTGRSPARAGALSPPSPPQQQLTQLQGAPLLFLSFASSAYINFLLNWHAHVAELGVPYLVAAFDPETAAVCQREGILHQELQLGYSNKSVRGDLAEFRRLGSFKAAFVLEVLERYGVSTVVVSDTDVAWLRDPTDYLQRHPAADWLISTDCLSHTLEEAWKPNHNQPRCGHIPGNSWGRALNTGVFVVRNRPPALQVLRAWRDLLRDDTRIAHLHDTHGLEVDDQLALNLLLEEGMWTARAVPEDPRTIWAANDTLQLHPLPVVLFPGGHVAFVQRLPWTAGAAPYLVHATFERYGQWGKQARFREFGLWRADPPSYYEDGRLLQYNNNVRQFIASLELRRGARMAPLHKQIVAGAYQLAAFRDALAIARLTNRTLVLPPSYCWCDIDAHPHIVERCRIRGSDLQLPFRCPADFIVNVREMDKEPGLRYRLPGFLWLPQVPPRIRNSRLAVEVLPQRPAAAPDPGSLLGHAARVWPGITAEQLLEALQPVAGAAVLEIRGMQPGLLSTLEGGPEGAAEFDALFRRITADSYWCCGASDGLPLEWRKFDYELPWPLADGWKAWGPPDLQAPPWCADLLARKEDSEFVSWPNHPCQFLTNTTAAAIAGDIT